MCPSLNIHVYLLVIYLFIYLFIYVELRSYPVQRTSSAEAVNKMRLRCSPLVMFGGVDLCIRFYVVTQTNPYSPQGAPFPTDEHQVWLHGRTVSEQTCSVQTEGHT